MVKRKQPGARGCAAMIALTVSIFLSGCDTAPKPDFDVGDATLIDVRSWREWRVQHVEGSHQIPWDCIVVGLQALGVEPHEALMVYSGTGELSGRALVSLRNMDYEQVMDLGGLDDALERTGKSLRRPQGARPDAGQLAVQKACAESRKNRPMG